MMLEMFSSSTSLLLVLLQLPLASLQPSDGSASSSRHEPHRFTPSLAIILAVLISAFFLMAFFSAYLRLCAADTLYENGPRRTGTRARSRGAARRGVHPAVVDTFPLFEYSAVKGVKRGAEALECAVSLNEYEDDDNLRLLPICSHVFHPTASTRGSLRT